MDLGPGNVSYKVKLFFCAKRDVARVLLVIMARAVFA